MDLSTPGFPSFTISQSLLRLMSIESMMPSNHLILCHPFSSVTSFSSWPKSFPASGSFPVSQFFISGGQNVGASASVVGTIAIEIQTYRRATQGNQSSVLFPFWKPLPLSSHMLKVSEILAVSNNRPGCNALPFVWPAVGLYINSFYPVRGVHFELHFMNEFVGLEKLVRWLPWSWEWQSGLSCTLLACAQAPSGPLAKLQQGESRGNSSPALSQCIAFRTTGPIDNNVRPLQLKAARALASCLLDVKTWSRLV